MLTLALQTDSRGVSAVCLERSPGANPGWRGVATIPATDDPAELAAKLRSVLPAIGSGRVEMGVALGSESVRVRRLSLPPAPEEELPAIVRLQAAREAAVDPEELVVDFLPEGETALVAWIESEKLDYWREVASALGAKLVSATPRAAATLLLIEDATSDSVVATRAGDTIDFASGTFASLKMVRTARAPEGDSEAVQRETRRTLLSLPDISAADILADPPIGPEAGRLDLKAIAGRLGVDVKELRSAVAATGLAVAIATEQTAPLNLIDPRRPPVAETGRRRLALLATAAALVIGLGVYWCWQRLARLDRDIALKKDQIAEARLDVEAFEPYRDRVEALDAWRATDVTWLDEIDRLGQGIRPLPLSSKDFDAESDMRVNGIRAVASTGRDAAGGKITLTAVARSTDTGVVEARLRSPGHTIEPQSITENPGDDAYQFGYSAELTVPAAVEEESP